MSKAFVFPGQGSQVVGMGLEFYQNFDVAKNTFKEVDDAIGKNLSRLMFEGPIETLTQTENSQPAIMCCSIAILRTLERETGLNFDNLCDYTAGHSLGEYTALCASKSILLSDTAKLLKIRGEAFAMAGNKNKGGMVALLGCSIEQAEEIAEKARQENEVCQIANDNTVGQVVLSGSEKSLEEVIRIAKEMNVKKAVPLKVSGAFHSELMSPAVDVMVNAFENIEIRSPIVPLIANVYANQVSEPDEIKKSLLKQLLSRVRWRETLLTLKENGVTEIVEIGGKVLTDFVKRTIPEVKAISITSIDSLRQYTLEK